MSDRVARLHSQTTRGARFFTAAARAPDSGTAGMPCRPLRNLRPRAKPKLSLPGQRRWRHFVHRRRAQWQRWRAKTDGSESSLGIFVAHGQGLRRRDSSSALRRYRSRLPSRFPHRDHRLRRCGLDTQVGDQQRGQRVLPAVAGSYPHRVGRASPGAGARQLTAPTCPKLSGCRSGRRPRLAMTTRWERRTRRRALLPASVARAVGRSGCLAGRLSRRRRGIRLGTTPERESTRRFPYRRRTTPPR